MIKKLVDWFLNIQFFLGTPYEEEEPKILYEEGVISEDMWYILYRDLIVDVVHDKEWTVDILRQKGKRMSVVIFDKYSDINVIVSKTTNVPNAIYNRLDLGNKGFEYMIMIITKQGIQDSDATQEGSYYLTNSLELVDLL